jgi:hypothetical protein
MIILLKVLIGFFIGSSVATFTKERNLPMALGLVLVIILTLSAGSVVDYILT